MPPERAEELLDLVADALELEAAARAAFIAARCDGDTTLRREAESLLARAERATHFMEQPAAGNAVELLAGEPTLPSGGRIGQYEIISFIGEGGMGAVYLAHDTELDRDVALKLVRSALNTAQFVRKFHAEKRILAQLNHPNIAQVHGGGVTPEGLPFFAMEFVAGERLDEFCARHRLSINSRLQLFRKVCGAVSYAHQHLVIHRDLKPGNILVTSEGEPKLLDFGIAKLLDDEGTLEREQTVTLAAVMTPDYASPEQVRGEAMTTASDVYCLGVILYELLTAQKPYRTKSSRLDEISRAIMEQEPARPSTAAVHGGNSKFLKGDLDNIVLTALRKEPERRYSSVAQFSEDIRRHLDGLPVMAHKDTVAYRASKFIARNRFGVAAAAVVVVAIIGGLIGALSQANRANRERDFAKQEKVKAEQVNDFLQSILSAASPEEKGNKATVMEVLNDARQRIETEFASQPELRAQILLTIGRTYYALGDMAEAEQAARAALDLNRKLHGDKNETTATCMIYLGLPLLNLGRTQEAENFLKQGLEIDRELRIPPSREFCYALFGLGELNVRRGESERARPLLEEALSLANKLRGENNEDSAYILVSIGRARQFAGDSKGAETGYRRAIEILRQLPRRFETRLAMALVNLGSLLTERESYDDAITALLESDRITEKIGDSVYLLASKQYLCAAYFRKGDFAKAIETGRRAIEVGRSMKLQKFASYSEALTCLGLSLTRTGHPADAEPYLREAMEIREQAPGKSLLAATVTALGECLIAQQRYAEADPLMTRGYEQAKASLGEKNPQTIAALQQLNALRELWPKR